MGKHKAEFIAAIIKDVECLVVKNSVNEGITFQINICNYIDNEEAIYKAALDLINRQKAEIEKLTTLCQEQNAEIKRLIETKHRLLYNLKAVCEEKVGDTK